MKRTLLACAIVVSACHRDASPEHASATRAVEAAVCKARDACRVVDLRAAGTTAGGDALIVVKTWIGEPARPDFEWWSVVLRGGAPISRQFLVEGGNECTQWGGGGATIAANQFTYVFTGSGAPTTSSQRAGLPYTIVVQLAPLAVISGPPMAKLVGPDTPIVSFARW